MKSKGGHIKLLIGFFLVTFLFVAEAVPAQSKDKGPKISKAQRERMKKSNHYTRKAERARREGNFALAEAKYREAVAQDAKNARADYNFGHLYGIHKRNAESMKRLLETAKTANSKELKHRVFHNLGNGYMADKDYGQAVTAYEKSLLNDPTDDETRYNLALAKEKLKKQQNQQKNDNKKDKKQDNKNKDPQKNRDNNKKQDKNQDKDEGKGKNQDKAEKKEQKKNKSNGNGQKKRDKDQSTPPQNPKDQEGERPPKKGELSKKQIENLLRAAANKEKGVQKKLDKKKGKKVKATSGNRKDW